MGSASVIAQQVGRVAFSGSRGLVLEHVVGDAVGRVQLLARDRPERCEVMLGRRFLGLVMGVAEEVAEPVGIALVAAVERLQRIAPEARLVAVLEQLEQPVVRARLSAALGAGAAARRRRRGRAASSEQLRIRPAIS